MIDGVTWDGLEDPAPLIRAVRSVSTWKLAARSFWGRWAQVVPLTCHANGKSWKLPNRSLNIPWAHVILARVRMRLFEVSARAVHVFTDSVITDVRLPTGENVGDWRLEKEYNGVVIRNTGQYTEHGAGAFEKMAGVSRRSPLRLIRPTT